MLTSTLSSERSHAGNARMQARGVGVKRTSLWERVRFVIVRSFEILGQSKTHFPMD